MKNLLESDISYKRINFANNILSFITVLFSVLTIILYQYKFAFTFSLILIPVLLNLLVYIYRNAYRINQTGFDFSDKNFYINLDTIVFCLVFIIGFSLSGFAFSSLYIMIALIISYIYQCIIYEIHVKVITNNVIEEKDE